MSHSSITINAKFTIYLPQSCVLPRPDKVLSPRFGHIALFTVVLVVHLIRFMRVEDVREREIIESR
jgi:hypothetical protein